MNASKKTLLAIVNYNQEKEIKALLNSVNLVLEKLPWDIQPVVIDDCSTDKSPEIAKSLGFEVIRHTTNRGVGAAIRSGINFGLKHNHQNLLILSANGKMQAEEIPIVLGPILDDTADYVQGSRRTKGGKSEGLSLFRTITIPIFSFFTSIALGRKFSDITCGYRAYRLDWLNSPQICLHQKWLDRYELEFYVHYWACRKKLRIKEVPVTIKYSHLEKGRKSYIRPFVGWWSMIRPFLYLSLGIKK